jgi:hypothetical protein
MLSQMACSYKILLRIFQFTSHFPFPLVMCERASVSYILVNIWIITIFNFSHLIFVFYLCLKNVTLIKAQGILSTCNFVSCSG